MRAWLLVAVAAIGCSSSSDPDRVDADAASITVDAAALRGRVRTPPGFVMGAGLEALPRVQALGATTWRMPPGHKSRELAWAVDGEVTYVVSNEYAYYRGQCATQPCDDFGWPQARPWDDYDGWDTFVAQLVQIVVDNGHAGEAWDLWNEPDNQRYWQGSLDQLVETLARGAAAVRRVDPSAKVVGPSFVAFESKRWTDNDTLAVLRGLSQRGVTLDAVSWHEFGYPQDIPAHVAAARAEGATAIHINEYGASSIHQVPGWAVLFEHYLDAADVDVAMRACWPVQSPGGTAWSNCDYGLDGLLMSDDTTPTVMYWLAIARASMAGQRLSAIATDNDLAAIASRDGQRVTVLVGRGTNPDHRDLASAPRNLTITLDNYTPTRITRLHLPADTYPARGGSVIDFNNTHLDPGVGEVVTTMNVPELADGDAYVFVVEND